MTDEDTSDRSTSDTTADGRDHRGVPSTGPASLADRHDITTLTTLASGYVADHHHTYLRHLREAVAEPRNLNIALTGRYGTGKSSILDQFESERDSETTLRVAISTLGPQPEATSDGVAEPHTLSNTAIEVINAAHVIPDPHVRVKLVLSLRLGEHIDIGQVEPEPGRCRRALGSRKLFSQPESPTPLPQLRRVARVVGDANLTLQLLAEPSSRLQAPDVVTVLIDLGEPYDCLSGTSSSTARTSTGPRKGNWTTGRSSPGIWSTTTSSTTETSARSCSEPWKERSVTRSSDTTTTG